MLNQNTSSSRIITLALVVVAAVWSSSAGGEEKRPTANEQATAFAKSIALHIIPHQYEDLRKWGKTKRIVSGLNVRLDGLRLRTNRRRKDVNHGTWRMYRLSMPHPDRALDIKVARIESKRGKLHLHVVCEARVLTDGRLQQWQRGIRLLSLSARGDAKIRLTADCEVSMRLDPSRLPPDVVLEPRVTRAEVELVEFRLDRVSRIGGEPAQQMAKVLKHILDDQLEKKRDRLVEKMNRQIDKRRDRLRLSFADYVAAQWDKHFKKAAAANASDRKTRGKPEGQSEKKQD